jgi:ubiquinone/menaquinone biosynthesis C-methylase UbiE
MTTFRSAARLSSAPAHQAQMDFSSITEQAGTPVTSGQIQDVYNRYAWAAELCRRQRVLEVACGTGQGLGLLARSARQVVGCDIEPKNVESARATYGSRVEVRVASAEKLPAGDGEMDVILLLEALYYLPSPESFLAECRRVLSPSGTLLLTTTNKDLSDFVPSALSTRYYGAAELEPLLAASGFGCQLFGQCPIGTLPLRHRVLNPLKPLARKVGLVPKTMRGKAVIRRILFGKLPPMPGDLSDVDLRYTPPTPLRVGVMDREHRNIYVVARRAR